MYLLQRNTLHSHYRNFSNGEANCVMYLNPVWTVFLTSATTILLLLSHPWKDWEFVYWWHHRWCWVPCLGPRHTIGNPLVLWQFAVFSGCRWSFREELQLSWWGSIALLSDYGMQRKCCRGDDWWMWRMLYWEHSACGIRYCNGWSCSSILAPNRVALQTHSKLVLKLQDFIAKHAVVITQFISLQHNLFHIMRKVGNASVMKCWGSVLSGQW